MTLTLLVVTVAWWSLGASVIESAWESESDSPWRRFLIDPQATGPERAVAIRDGALRAGLAVLWMVWVPVLLVAWAIRVRPRKRVWIPVVLLAYLGTEQFAAPSLVRPWKLQHYGFVKDPDHRPEGRAEARGWNADGLRQDREPEAYRAEDYNVVFLGDSFTMGLKLERPWVEAFPHQVGKRLGAAFPDREIRTANFGWTSSSPRLSARRLMDIGEAYHPDLVCLCIDMTDAHDDIKWGNLLDRRGICALYDVLPITIGALRGVAPSIFQSLYDWSTGNNMPYLRYFASEQELDASRPYLEAHRDGIDACAEQAAELGAEFCVFVLPRYYQYSETECPEDVELRKPERAHERLGPYALEPFRWYAELGEQRDYPVHALLDDFRDAGGAPHCLADDPHWNLRGHQIAAGAIARRLVPWLGPRLR